MRTIVLKHVSFPPPMRGMQWVRTERTIGGADPTTVIGWEGRTTDNRIVVNLDEFQNTVIGTMSFAFGRTRVDNLNEQVAAMLFGLLEFAADDAIQEYVQLLANQEAENMRHPHA